MKTITEDAVNTLASNVVDGAALLLEMHLSETMYLTTAGVPLTYAGNQYLALGSFGGIESVEDTPAESKSIKFVLSGVSIDLLAIALAEPIRNKAAYIRFAILDPESYTVEDAPLIWSGTLDQMSIQISKESSTISVTAEHRGVTYARPKPLRYTDIDQQRLFPGDTCLRFITDQANKQIVWPAASFFRR